MGNITYVCGHRNPDTDSIVAAISYAALQNMLGEAECRPVRLGSLNDETAALLKRFGFEAPELITDVRTQVRDIAFDRPPCLDKNVSVSRAWDLLRENHTISALPVINKNGTLFGLVTAGGIAESDMRSIQNPVLENIPIYNILSTLEGHILNGNDTCFESVSGEVHLCMPTAGDNFGGIQKGGIILNSLNGLLAKTVTAITRNTYATSRLAASRCFHSSLPSTSQHSTPQHYTCQIICYVQ